MDLCLAMKNTLEMIICTHCEKIMLHGKNNFTVVSKNLARYRSEINNNFMWDHQLLHKAFKHDTAAKSFDIIVISLTVQ
jgi:hypothetical protein